MATKAQVPQETVGHKVLYQIVEVKGQKKPLWNRAGVGFINKDGSINVIVDALPNCRFQLRTPNPKPEAEEEPDKKATVNRNTKFKR
jgi:hypothetical protein